MFGGSNNAAGTKLSLTLPISCQICLEKVKDPVTCPQQHVFCSLCLEIWLERSSQCPTCRTEITPETPIRKIIGGLPQAHGETHTSPGTSRQLRRARMELLMKDYDDEVDTLRTEIAGLKHTNNELRSRLAQAEKTTGYGGSGKKACSRCGNMQDIDSMLEMAKNLQEATKTFAETKKENEELKLSQSKLAKEYDDLKRHNASVREEVLMRSPMKFGRLTVAALEKRVGDYERQVTQLQKALEKNDAHTESLLERLNSCSCSASVDVADGTRKAVVVTKDVLSSDGRVSQCIPERDAESKSESSRRCENTDKYINSSPSTSGIGSVNRFVAIDSSTLPHSDIAQITSHMASTSAMTADGGATGFTNAHAGPQRRTPAQSETEGEYRFQSDVRDVNAKAKCFTAQMMPLPDSPDYGDKLCQIQNNLLHPIAAAADSTTGNPKSFSRRLFFDQAVPTSSKLTSKDSTFLRLQSPSNVGASVSPKIESQCPDFEPGPISSALTDAGMARITAAKLVQSRYDGCVRPSSAPSRTFLLSGARFSALTPIDNQQQDEECGSEHDFQPVKTVPPSSLVLASPLAQKRNLPATAWGDDAIYDPAAPSCDPGLKLISPDDVLVTDWKSRSSPCAPPSPRSVCAPTGCKGSISKVGILKRNSSILKMGSHAGVDAQHAIFKQRGEEDASSTPSRRNVRKQSLSEHTCKRLGDNSLEFLSPVKSRKTDEMPKY